MEVLLVDVEKLRVEVYRQWDLDSTIDRSELGEESLRTPQLHSKWRKVLAFAHRAVAEREVALKALRLGRYEFYTMGPTREQHEAGLRLPPQGKVLKAAGWDYVDIDPDVVSATLALAEAKDLADHVSSIMKSIMSRDWTIGRAIEWFKMMQGVK